MEKFTSLPDIFLESLQTLFIKIVAYTPNIIAALLLVIVGYIVARLIALIITSLCNQIGLNNFINYWHNHFLDDYADISCFFCQYIRTR